jgi:RNA polymerase sigma-70 factor (ECF subfamily)
MLLDPVDLLQDTFVNIYRYAGTFRNEQPTSFRVWSRRIAMNVVRRARMPRREDPLPEGSFEPADRRSGPSESASSLEQSRELAGAWLILLGHYAEIVLELRERDRVALGLVEVSGLSYAAAAARLGVGASNMKMIVFRARKRIRREIARRLGARDLLESEAA